MAEIPNRELAVFSAARQLTRGERGAYLDQACAGDVGLRECVEELLEAIGEAGGFLETPAAAMPPAVPTEKVGDRIGRYKLLQKIGEGGCGVVYMAGQEEPVRRKVALKIIKLGMDTKEVIARFEMERQALALMDHSNIARVLDAGATDTGRPYFVMELVRGVKITDYCDENKLTTRERLELFIKVCHALQHAHQKGVIHRDIKPSNILIADHDGLPVPKIIDFGIAKATADQRLTDKTLFTAFEQFIGTPAYMSPEQAMMSGLDIDTRSDIYSLGILLYESLTGQTPFDAREMLQSGLDEMRRTICDDEPERPSTRMKKMPGKEVTSIAERRKTEPLKLVRVLRGDLDWIVMKALEKDRTRRYDTANSFAADVQRYLNNEPVEACPPSAIYKFEKLVRRNKLAFIASGIVAATGILGLLGILWQWRQAGINAQEAMNQRGIAEQVTAKTRLNLYAADISVASQALKNGDLRLARETLDGWRPKPGETDMRGFEWRYLWNLCRGEQLATFAGHEQNVTCTAFSPDGNRLATGSLDGTVRIWDVATHQSIATLKAASNQVWSVGFTPDGSQLVTGRTKGVEFRDVDTWRVRTNFPGQSGVLSTSGNILATSDSSAFFFEPPGRVSVWNWSTGELIRRIDWRGRALALSVDGRLLGMMGANWSISVWDTATGNLVRQWAMTHPVWSLNFSPDGRQLLAAGWSREVSVLKLDDSSSSQVIAGQRLNFWSAAFSPDGAMIATTGTDRRVRLWDAATLEPEAALQGHEGEVWCAAFSPDGKMLASGGSDQMAMLWPTTASQSKNDLPHDSDHSLEFSPDGKSLVTVNPITQNCMLWDARTSALISPRLAQGQFVYGFSKDGRCVAAVDSARWVLQFWLPNGTRPEWEVALQGRAADAQKFDVIAMSPAQDFLFAIEGAGWIWVWDTDTGRLLHKIQGPVPPIRNAVMSSDGKYLALSIERESVVRLYDCATGAERELAGHRDFVSGISFSPDTTTLATSSMDGTIRLWNVRTGESTASLPAHMGEATDVAFSPDGRTLASLGKVESLKLWHLPTLREVVYEDMPQAGIHLRFSRDGRHLAVEIAQDKVRLLAAPSE